MDPATATPEVFNQNNPHVCQEKVQSAQTAATSNIPKAGTAVEGKHIAKREASQWPDYGDPEIWDIEFEKSVLEAVSLIKAGDLKSSDLFGYFEKKRNDIAVKRQNRKSVQFGLRRDYVFKTSIVDYARSFYTPLCLTSPYVSIEWY